MTAIERVARVRDDPEGRYRLREDFYRKYGFSPDGGAGYGASELAFLRWEIGRGVLNPLDHPTQPGSRWWRNVNESFLLDAEIAADIDAGAAGADVASESVRFWLRYFRKPSRRAWYRAHNGSIASGYLQHADIAATESDAERTFVNMVLYRVLYAQALVEGEAPGLIYRLIRWLIGHSAVLSELESVIADPRGPSVDLLVHLPDFYPRHYPLSAADIQHVFERAHGLQQDAEKLMDRVLISPYLTALYKLAARWLQNPRLCDLVVDGKPCYPVQPRPASIPGRG
jgi:hypothetical protein